MQAVPVRVIAVPQEVYAQPVLEASGPAAQLTEEALQPENVRPNIHYLQCLPMCTSWDLWELL